MKPRTIIIAVFNFLFLLSSNVFADRTAPLIIDHTTTDISQIPENWIEQAKSQMKWHYAHTSHGGQLTTGLARIEDQDSAFSHSLSTSGLPTATGELSILDGMRPIGDTYITPNEYFSDNWDAPYHADTLLNRSEYAGRINVSAFSWCTQMNYSGYDSLVDDYLRAMTHLEEANPDVTFVYLTGNAQCGPGNQYCSDLEGGYRRFVRNEQIRAYCRENNKVLFDFADIDSWWYNTENNKWEQATFEHQVGDHTIRVPYEHPHYNLNQAAHTSYENCENKGKAVWHLMARLAGWGDCITSPTGLDAQLDSENRQITLNWTHHAPDTRSDRYIIQRRIDEGAWTNDYGSVGGDATTFIDTRLATGNHQYRAVARLNDDGEGNPCDSAVSNVVSIQIQNPNDTDSDGDGVPDEEDGCPDDGGKTAPEECGCGVSDADGDEDGTPDCNDQCPQDSEKIDIGQCGCGVPESDQCSTKPLEPELMTPPDAATDTDLSPSLGTGDFQDPDNGDTHAQSIWQVSKNLDFSELLYDETSDEHLTTFSVVEPLEAGTTYFWRSCHVDNRGAQSEWSEPFSFTTGVQGQTPDSTPDDNNSSDKDSSSGCFISALGF